MISPVAASTRSIGFWIAIPLVLGIAAGYVGGRLTGVPSTAEAGGRTSQPDEELEGQRKKVGNGESSFDRFAGVDPILAPRLELLERIAAADLEDLPELSRELFDGDHGWGFVDALLDRWIELAPEAGLSFILAENREHGGNQWQRAAYDYCGQWARVDPDAAFAAAQVIEDEQVKRVAMDRISKKLASQRPADFFRILQSSGGGEIVYWRNSAALSLAISDPQAAIAVLEALDSHKAKLTPNVVSGWAKTDPEGALAWVRTFEDEEGRTRGLQAVACRLMDSDPDRAAALFKECEGADGAKWTSSGPRYGWRDAVGFLSQQDPEAAMAWVAKHFPASAAGMMPNLLPQDAVSAVDALADLPAGALTGGKLTGRPTDFWRPVNIEAGIAHLPNIADPITRESTHAWLLGAMAAEDPESAITSAGDNLSDSANRAHVYKQGMANWAREDITAASEWLASRPPGPETDGAIASLIEVAKYLEPESAVSWAAEISAPSGRLGHLAAVYRVWAQTDESAAREALSSMSFTPDEIAVLKKKGVDLEP